MMRLNSFLTLALALALEQADYQAHVAAAEAANVGMPAVMVNHGGVGEGAVAKDIRMENFSISMGGRELINEATVTLAHGRRYGEYKLFPSYRCCDCF